MPGGAEHPHPPEVVSLVTSSSDCSDFIALSESSWCSGEIIVIGDSDDESEVTSSAATQNCRVAFSRAAPPSQPRQQQQKEREKQHLLQNHHQQQQQQKPAATSIVEVLPFQEDAWPPKECSLMQPARPGLPHLAEQGRGSSRLSGLQSAYHMPPRPTQIAHVTSQLQSISTTPNCRRFCNATGLPQQHAAEGASRSAALQLPVVLIVRQPSTPSAINGEAATFAMLSGGLHSTSDEAPAVFAKLHDAATTSEGRGSTSPPADAAAIHCQLVKAVVGSTETPLQSVLAKGDPTRQELQQLSRRLAKPSLCGHTPTHSSALDSKQVTPGTQCLAEGPVQRHHPVEHGTHSTWKKHLYRDGEGSSPASGMLQAAQLQPKMPSSRVLGVWRPRRDAATPGTGAVPVTHCVSQARQADATSVYVQKAKRRAVIPPVTSCHPETNAEFAEAPSFEYKALQHAVKPVDLEICDIEQGSESAVMQMGLQYRVRVSPCEGSRKSLGDRVCALERIPKDKLLAEYTGEVLNKQQVRYREKRFAGERCYLFELHDQIKPHCAAIDARLKGNVTRILNHSCEPNLEVDLLWDHRNRLRILFKATKDIDTGHELTINYKPQPKNDAHEKALPLEEAMAGRQHGAIRCLCETESCIGYTF